MFEIIDEAMGFARLTSLLMLADVIYTDVRPTIVTVVSVAMYSAMLKHFAPFQICKKKQALDRPVVAHMRLQVEGMYLF